MPGGSRVNKNGLRIRIVRRHVSVVKIRVWAGHAWGDVRDAHPRDVLTDGGAGWGWAPPAA
ncbi:hypothetical protein CVAR_2130 [Corynebacterium variabile DSM 44702]|uniref:Uncharacterized protein n=1 Tax=Corynebacterium variabile (strain DSM 44702 / CIP 107183 / JCM 12073 / NCIMB 30131) TaxID=858619 RepID=G0HF28_CORVD|nr:hypothetical protein CVAR_2130 [Corynebacterium variabile DSM 44702]